MSDPFMSAWVYRGLVISKKLNQKVNDALLNRTRKFLYTELEERQFTPTARAYILSALAEGGGLEKSMVDKLVELVPSQSPYGLALTGLTLQSVGDSRAGDIYNKAVSKSPAAKNPLTQFKQGQDLEQDEVEFTAALLMLGIRLDKKDDTINNLATALLQNRRNEAWNNSRDTAMAVLALAEMMEKTRDESGDTALTIFIDGNEMKSLVITADKLYENEMTYIFPAEKISAKPVVKILKKSGAPLHVMATLQYFDSSDSFVKENHGISISRKYKKMGSGGFISKQFSAGETTSFAPGDLVMVELEVESNRENRYFMIEDPLLPGFDFVKNDSGYYSTDYTIEYDSRQILGDRIVFFTGGPVKNFTVRYFISVGLPGTYTALPSRASLMYYPETYGITGDTRLQVEK